MGLEKGTEIKATVNANISFLNEGEGNEGEGGSTAVSPVGSHRLVSAGSPPRSYKK